MRSPARCHGARDSAFCRWLPQPSSGPCCWSPAGILQHPSHRPARNPRFSNRRSGLGWQRPQRRLRRGQTEPASPATATSPDAPTFVQVAVGENHSCALQSSGRVQCWGANDDGQLDVPEGVSFQQITAGYRYSCGIRADGGVTCWGRNDHAQLDAPDGQFTSIDAGWDHVCALSGIDAICWGWNANERATPPPDASRLTAIGAGAEHSCGLTPTRRPGMLGKEQRRAGGFREPRTSSRAGGRSSTHTCALTNEGTARHAREKTLPATYFDAPETVFTSDERRLPSYTCGLQAEPAPLHCWGSSPNKASQRAVWPRRRGPFNYRLAPVGKAHARCTQSVIRSR